jgi:hypothetical protein
MKTIVYRVQCKEGRGPFKPGFSHRWVDPDVNIQNKPTIMEDFGWDFMSKCTPGAQAGCAFQNLSDLRRWFSGDELIKLYDLGYRVCEITVDRIVMKSSTQMLVESKKGFRSGARKITLKKLEELVPV